MPKTAYPVGGDVWEFLIGAGLMETSPDAAQQFLDLDGAAEWARDHFENKTGRFVDTEDVALYFDPPGPDTHNARGSAIAFMGGSRTLFLDSPLISLTSLTTGYSPDAAGDVLTEHVDFDLYPLNAASRNKPWEWIEFRARQWGPPRSIVLVGKRGYRPDGTIPNGVWQPLVQGAAEHLGPQLQAALTKGVIEWSEADVKEKYDYDPLGKQLDRWRTRFEQAILEYTVVVL